MYGHVICDGLVAVDHWGASSARYHFLTHARHRHALTGCLRRWPDSVPVYTSALTAQLLRRVLQLRHLTVRVLPLDEPVLLRPQEDGGRDDGGEQQWVEVTALESGHCAGSVMLLLRGASFGCVLYSGEARYSDRVLQSPVLRGVLGGAGVDVLYLDNTYCAPECEFASGEHVAERLVQLAVEWQRRRALVLLGLPWLGKEQLVVQLATRLQQPVYVSGRRRRAVLSLLYPSCRHLISDSPAGATVHAVSYRRLLRLVATITATPGGQQQQQWPLCMLPTARHIGWPGTVPPSAGLLQLLPYSSHSSFSELSRFVRQLAARSVQPIVTRWQHRHRGDSDDWRPQLSLSVRADMSVFRTFIGSSSSAVSVDVDSAAAAAADCSSNTAQRSALAVRCDTAVSATATDGVSRRAGSQWHQAGVQVAAAHTISNETRDLCRLPRSHCQPLQLPASGSAVDFSSVVAATHPPGSEQPPAAAALPAAAASRHCVSLSRRAARGVASTGTHTQLTLCRRHPRRTAVTGRSTTLAQVVSTVARLSRRDMVAGGHYCKSQLVLANLPFFAVLSSKQYCRRSQQLLLRVTSHCRTGH